MGTAAGYLALAATSAAVLAGLVAFDRYTATPAVPAQSEVSAPVGRVRDDGADRAPSLLDAKHVEETARVFLAAYLPYTHNQPQALTTLPRGTADPRLVACLLADRPHARPSVGLEAVGRVWVERVTDHEAVAMADIHAPDGRYAVALTLTRDNGHWTVTATRPGG